MKTLFSLTSIINTGQHATAQNIGGYMVQELGINIHRLVSARALQ